MFSNFKLKWRQIKKYILIVIVTALIFIVIIIPIINLKEKLL